MDADARRFYKIDEEILTTAATERSEGWIGASVELRDSDNWATVEPKNYDEPGSYCLPLPRASPTPSPSGRRADARKETAAKF